MSKKNVKENLVKISINHLLSDRFGRYSKYIIQDRAIPDARDGLKPVQRRILYAMQNLQLLHDKPYKKSARVVGEVIGKYHPHGDSSIYDAMVRMAQDWKINVPLVEMQGNKGSIDNDPAAAMRYTEVRLAKTAELMMKRLSDKTIPFTANFDDSEIEPTILPSLVPNLLINGTSGIAAGYATEMPPHNPLEIIDAIIYQIKFPECTFEELREIVQGPDFPTGGIVDQQSSNLTKALKTGRGRIAIQAKYYVENKENLQTIIITNIPYGVVKSRLIKMLDDIIYDKKVYGMKEVRDESDKNGVRIAIDLQKDAKRDSLLNYLFQKTNLQVYYNYNGICIYKSKPTLLGLQGLINVYIEHRKTVVRNYLQHDLAQSKKRLEIVEGFIRVSMMASRVIAIIRSAGGSRKGVVKALEKHFQFTKIQSEAIADLRLYRLSRTDHSSYLAESKKLHAEIDLINNELSDQNAFNQLLIDQLENLKVDFASFTRKTKVLDNLNWNKKKINAAALVKTQDINITISYFGYFKRFSDRVLESNSYSSFGIKNDDLLVQLNHTNTKNSTLIITTRGTFVVIPNYKFTDGNKWRNFGTHLNMLTSFSAEARIIAAIDVENFALPLYLVMASEKGFVKKIPLSDFELKHHQKSSLAFRIKDNDRIVKVELSSGNEDLVFFTENNYVYRFAEQVIPEQNIRSINNLSLNLERNSKLSTFAVAKTHDTIGITFKTGYFSKVNIDQIKQTSISSHGNKFFDIPINSPKRIQFAQVLNEESILIYGDEKLQYFPVHKMLDIYNEKAVVPIARSSANRSKILNNHKAFLEHRYLKDNIDNILKSKKVKKSESKVVKTSAISLKDIFNK